MKPLHEDPALAQCTAQASKETEEGEGADTQTAWKKVLFMDKASSGN